MPRFVTIALALEQPRRKTPIPGGRTIYAIVGPSRRVAYVGVTRMRLARRLQWHLEEPTNQGMSRWFDEVASAGATPEIVALEYVSEAEWEDAERGWIAWFRQRGELLNVDRGGQARDGSGSLRGFQPGALQPPRRNTGPARPGRAQISAALFGQPLVARKGRRKAAPQRSDVPGGRDGSFFARAYSPMRQGS